jgi:hypothetical protein
VASGAELQAVDEGKEMTDWASLRHAYGSADDLPALLAALPSQRERALEALYARICHQGTVYSASFAALPVLAQIAARLEPPDRFPILRLAGVILCSDDVAGSREAFLRPVADVIPRFQELCRDGLFAGLGPSHFVEHLRLARYFDGDWFWGERLEFLTVEYFGGHCPHCRASLYLSIGEGISIGDDSFVALWEHRKLPGARRSPLAPLGQFTDDAGRWLYEQSRRAGQLEVANALRYLFGSAPCPACGKRFWLPDA